MQRVRFQALQLVDDECEKVGQGGAFLATTYADLLTIAKSFCDSKYASTEQVFEQSLFVNVTGNSPQSDAEKPCRKGMQALREYINEQGGRKGDVGVEGRALAIHVFCDAVSMEAADAAAKKSLLSGGSEQGCFPADATVQVNSDGLISSVALRDVRVGELVAVGDAKSGTTWFSRLLTEFHTPSEHSAPNVEYLMITHEYGTMNLTAGHGIATLEHGFVPAGKVNVGDSLLSAATDDSLRTSRVLSLRTVQKIGMFGPLTWSGTIMVDGVLASSYMVTAEFVHSAALENFVSYIGGWNNAHSLLHYVFLPMRASHAFLPAHWLGTWFNPSERNVLKNAEPLAWPKYVDMAAVVLGRIVKLF
jgi:hypothetical protein